MYDANEGGLALNVELSFGRYGNRLLKKCFSSKFIVHPEYLNNDENYDFAVISLEENIGNKLGWGSLRVFNDQELDGALVNVSGYPGTKGFFNTLFSRASYEMYTMEGKIVSVRKHKIYYHLDTSGGQSGSGVWILNDQVPECLAVHTTGKGPREEGNGAIRINEENFNIINDWLNFYRRSE